MGTEAAVAVVSVVSFEAGVECVDVLVVLGVGVLCSVPGEVNPVRALRWMDANVGCCCGLSLMMGTIEAVSLVSLVVVWTVGSS